MRHLRLALALASLTLGTPAAASTVVDPVGDFIPSYTGPQTGEFDVTSFSVLFDPSTSLFRIAGTLNGAIDPETDGYYVIGVNTGAGAIDPFGSIGQPDVEFDRVVVVAGEGEAFIGGEDLAFDIFGNSFLVWVPLSLLPSTGAEPLDYGFNLWPRTEIDTPGNLAHISDFAPNNALLKATAVPEPVTWLTMLLGFGLAGAAIRFRRGRRLTLDLG
jgi:hypothetical protein